MSDLRRQCRDLVSGEGKRRQSRELSDLRRQRREAQSIQIENAKPLVPTLLDPLQGFGIGGIRQFGVFGHDNLIRKPRKMELRAEQVILLGLAN